MNLRTNERVSIELEDDGVAQVRLTRADKMNALDADMFNYLIEAGQHHAAQAFHVLQSLAGFD